MRRLLVGLGNPGPAYETTRHNVGFLVVDDIAREFRIRLRATGTASVGRGTIAGHAVALAKPLTYMNASGAAVKPLVRSLDLATPADLIVIHDDVDLVLGRLRVRQGGSAAGHKGLLSLILDLGTADFVRVRVGIGRPPAGAETADYVLTPFRDEELPLVAAVVRRGREAVVTLLTDGLTATMNLFNRRDAVVGPPGRP